MIHSYPSIYNLGHAAIVDLLKGPVIVEEKIDGSQFSFWKRADGEVECRSKGAPINMLAPEGMFKAAVKTVLEIATRMRPDVVYRGEYLAGPHHNALTYSRVPSGNIIIFDVNPGLETYLDAESKRSMAAELGLECVPVLFIGVVSGIEQFRKLLDTESVLGGQKIEGVVIKPAAYNLFGRDKKVLMGKFVSESFREVQAKAWDSEHRTKGPQEILSALQSRYGTSARWNKALIHLRERGEIENDPRDIGKLMKEVPEDVLKECAEDIRKDLFEWAWPQLRRMLARGLPEWYKEELLKKQFENTTAV
ncbi:hypothetical protein KGP36_02785 [Patescibacteria group bacterium]|nr:hypothetical protein [Patescibacteria group bacterium]